MKPLRNRESAPGKRRFQRAVSSGRLHRFSMRIPQPPRAGSAAYPGAAPHSVDCNGLLFAQPSNKSAHKRAALTVLKMKNPGGLFSSPGFGIFCLTLFQAVQSASRAGIIATAIIMPTTMTLRISRLTRSSASRPKAARSSLRWERRLDIRFFNLKKWVASNRRSQYRPSSLYRLLNTFYQKINHAYHMFRRTTSPNSVVLTRFGWLLRSGVP